MKPDENKTVWLKPPGPVIVKIEQGGDAQVELRFTETFRIGRDKDCQVQLKDSSVSKFHAEVQFDGERWWVKDLESTNGTYMNGVLIQRLSLPSEAKLELGRGGPALWLSIEKVEAHQDKLIPTSTTLQTGSSPTEFINRYFAKSMSGKMGEHTLMIRDAFKRLTKKQSKRYKTIIVAVMILLVGAGGIAGYQQVKLRRLKNTAQDIFYTMKTLELQISLLEDAIATTGDAKQRAEIATKRVHIKELEKSYDKFVDELGINTEKMSEEERIIYRVARLFGECEVGMPGGFVREVLKYIKKWKSSQLLRTSIEKVQKNGYSQKVSEEMLANHLPPQFLYLALKESGFNHRAIGPETRYGIAKGAWQLIPETALRYGLHTGPLVEIRKYDPLDERHDFEKSTKAAAKYLKDIYNTEAQASGLLVIAGYNWGENRVRSYIRKMPENPRERNLWQLLKRYKIPQETYDYVFYIFSAVVIGENPSLFGFDFSNPLPKTTGS